MSLLSPPARQTCISCGARKPEGTNRPLDDWRDGEKLEAIALGLRAIALRISMGPWSCSECLSKNEGGAMYCMQCKQPSPEMKRAIEEEKQQRAADEGRGGGLFDRQDSFLWATRVNSTWCSQMRTLNS
eukprot:g13530.t1